MRLLTNDNEFLRTPIGPLKAKIDMDGTKRRLSLDAEL